MEMLREMVVLTPLRPRPNWINIIGAPVMDNWDWGLEDWYILSRIHVMFGLITE